MYHSVVRFLPLCILSSLAHPHCSSFFHIQLIYFSNFYKFKSSVPRSLFCRSFTFLFLNKRHLFLKFIMTLRTVHEYKNKVICFRGLEACYKLTIQYNLENISLCKFDSFILLNRTITSLYDSVSTI